ncbi:hypothetical protein BK004_02925 [bacterium CG10_46_32]|nr:MAG: hypothetical protein BK004_02925 [bacterium CG10_46_32]PIR56054.1 MAG: hypothetical protein COU73_02955 [Parcubacteria group bacterium CG10_big_fil_rev_8_21_14_0_10_46_32]
MLEEILQNLSFQEERALSEDVALGAMPLDQEGALLDYQKRTAIALLYKNPFQTRQLLETLEAGLSGLAPEPRGALEGVLTLLSYGILPEMPWSDVERFFSERALVAIFSEPILCNLSEAVRMRLVDEYESATRDALRERIRAALHENESTISEKNMQGSERGSIAYWLKMYDSEMGTGRAEALVRATFENKIEIQKHIQKDELALLRRLFEFYEWLKIPSDSLAGFEEDTVIELPDARYVLTDGVLIDITEGASISGQGGVQSQGAEQFNAPQQQPKTLFNYARVLQSRIQLLESAQGSPKASADALAQSLGPQQAEQALASLLLLAQLRQLDNLMEDPRFSKLVGDDLRKAHQDDMISGMVANPGAPQYIARLLKVILEDKLNLSHADAINFGSRLAKILAMEGEKYQSIIKDTKWNL